jgi:hypothetical protein
MTTRPGLASLLCDAAGVSLLVRSKAGPWREVTEATLGTWERYARDVGVPPALVADYLAMRSLPGIGEATARLLLCGGRVARRKGKPHVDGYGRAAAAVEVAMGMAASGPLDGLTLRQTDALRAAGADGGAGLETALAVARLRDDAVGVGWEREETPCAVSTIPSDRPQTSEPPTCSTPSTSTRPGPVASSASPDGALPEPAQDASGPARTAPSSSTVASRTDRLAIPATASTSPSATPSPASASASPSHEPAWRCPPCAAGRCGIGDGCADVVRCACLHGRAPLPPAETAPCGACGREIAVAYPCPFCGAGRPQTREAPSLASAEPLPGKGRAPWENTAQVPGAATGPTAPKSAGVSHEPTPPSAVAQAARPRGESRTMNEIETSYLEADAPLARRPDAAIAPSREDAPVVRHQPASLEPALRPGPRTSDSTEELYRALAMAQLEFEPVEKKRDNLHFKSKYANLSDVTAAIMPALKKHGLVPMQIPMGDRVYVRIVHGPSAQWIEGGLPLALPDRGSDVQRMGSAITYVRRYLLCMMLGIVAQDEDDDGQAAVARR